MCGVQDQDVVHLYPLWSAALQGNVERFPIDDDATALADSDAPVCRSNAVIEAHFRGVKHGRLHKRRRMRPREFVSAELKYMLWVR